jgi:hypothetical protein
MDDLDKQIEAARERLKKTQQLAELNELQKQATEIGQPQKKITEPMEIMMKWAFPAGCILAGLGVVAIMMLHSFAAGLALGALGALAIGFKIGMTPGMKVPFMNLSQKDEKPGSWIALGPKEKS